MGIRQTIKSWFASNPPMAYEVFEDAVDSDGSDQAYHPAPDHASLHPSGYNGPSHLFAIRYRDRRRFLLLDESRLDVIFRQGKEPNTHSTEGYYVPPSDDDGQAMYDRLISAQWPYSTVLRPSVINAGWTWVKVS